MAELRHEWNQMQAERTRERIARDTIKHRDRRIRELEAEVTSWRRDRAALLTELRKDPDLYGWVIDWLEG